MTSKETAKAVEKDLNELNKIVEDLSSGLYASEELLTKLANSLTFIPVDTATSLIQDNINKDNVRILNDVMLSFGRISVDIGAQKSRYAKVQQDLLNSLNFLKAGAKAIRNIM